MSKSILLRACCAMLAVTFVLSGATVMAVTCEATGDLDNSGYVTTVDWILFVQLFADGTLPPALWQCDVNGDGVINGADFQMVRDYVFPPFEPFPPAYVDCDLSLAQVEYCGAFTNMETGNVDYDAEGVRDLTDILALASYAFLSGDAPWCMADMNVDGDAGCVYDLGDVLKLASYAYLGGDSPAACMWQCE